LASTAILPGRMDNSAAFLLKGATPGHLTRARVRKKTVDFRSERKLQSPIF